MTETKPKFQIKLGWKKDNIDHRDVKFSFPSDKIDLPTKTDLSHTIRQIFKQDYNDCVANGTSNLITSLDFDTKYIKYTPSRLFIYYNAREIDGNECFDEGTTIRNAMKCIAKSSFLSEENYKYIDQHVFKKPPINIYTDAKSKPYYVKCYKNITNTEYNIKYALYQGHVIIFGALLFDSFVHYDTNFKVPDPEPSRESTLGGHCMLIVGYDDIKQCFFIANSWGEEWCDKGFHYMSYKYICSDLCSDFWLISSLTKDI